MKTRIVYPKMWNDDKFPQKSLEAKVLFLYLITCDTIGLTPYHQITDRKIIFDTSLTSEQLQLAKKELQDMHWCFFYENWVFHNHDCAYVNYDGRDRVKKGKFNEMEKIPEKVKLYFNPLITRYKEVINLSLTSIKPVLNPKSKTINHKINNKYNKIDFLKKLNDDDINYFLGKYNISKEKILSKADELVLYCEAKGKRYTNYKSFLEKAILKEFSKKVILNSKPLSDLIN